ncbi:MAG: hypothetical protein ACSW8C_04670 [bacterium]
MWRFSFLFVCFLVICSFCGGGPLDEYCEEFWRREKEKPHWERRGCSEPLSFDKLLEGSPDKTVQGPVKDNWKLNECLLALQLLVGQDMYNQDMYNKGIETYVWEDFEGEVSCVESDPAGPEVSKDFWQTVLFANYFIGGFRTALKEQLKKLGVNPDKELKKIVRSFLPKKCERPRSPYGVSFTGM